ncbi:MAG TPA: response regulator transcription factor [Bacteroidota bacterium]|nr:response regulator transcription factor [Bacteroidota bacterium]
MRILIIEDERKVAQFLRKGFEAEAFSVDIAPDGAEGRRLALAGSYDALILDLMLPKIDGMTLLEELRRERVDTPVLILTARGEVEDRVKGLNLGADDYLAKPFSFAEVLARVRAILRRSAGDGRSPVLELGDLKMDLPTRSVRRGGRELTLTNKEYELLEYLLRNKGRVVSRVILTEHIWDMGFDSETNVVDVLVNRLRRKVDEGFPRKLIQTVRGVGYVLKDAAGDEHA